MAEMQWYAATDSGRFDGTAAITPRSGAVCLRAELPAGVLQNAVAALPWTMAHEEKIFMNGYQTWTACPELGKWDRQHGVERVPKFLLEKYSFDRYGDYHFVPYSGKRGQSHGFSYCYFRRGKTYRLLASLDEAPGYTIFSYDSRTAQLRIERDCAGVQHTGGSFLAFSLFFAEGTEDEVFDAWFAALGCRPRTTRRLAGYSSWYNRYQNIDEASIQEDLNGCKTLFRAGDLFQIDDGWERKVGDWLEPDPAKFPNGCARWQMQPMKAAFWQDCGWHRSSAKRNPCSAKITRTGCCRRTVSPGAAAATGAAFMRWTSTTRRYRPTSSRSLTASCRIGALTLSSWTFSTAQHRSATPGNPAQDGCSAPWHCCAHGAATS